LSRASGTAARTQPSGDTTPQGKVHIPGIVMFLLYSQVHMTMINYYITAGHYTQAPEHLTGWACSMQQGRHLNLAPSAMLHNITGRHLNLAPSAMLHNITGRNLNLVQSVMLQNITGRHLNLAPSAMLHNITGRYLSLAPSVMLHNITR